MTESIPIPNIEKKTFIYNHSLHNNMKHNIEEFQKYAAEKGGECLSTEYISTDRKLMFKCKNNHIWECRADSILTNHWCKQCADSKCTYTIEDFNKIAVEKGGSCLSTKYAGPSVKLKFRCKEGHEWESFPQPILKGGWCRKCNYNNIPTKFTIEDIKAKAIERGFTCLSTSYKNKQKLKFKCKNGHEFKIRRDQLYGTTGCKYCNLNVEEGKVREIFEKLFNKKFPNTRPNFLKNSNTGLNLEIDGYNKELKLAFEYNGEQHYNHVELFHRKKSLKFIQNRDKIKNKICKDNGIVLITIPYIIKNYEEYIKMELYKHDIKY